MRTTTWPGRPRDAAVKCGNALAGERHRRHLGLRSLLKAPRGFDSLPGRFVKVLFVGYEAICDVSTQRRWTGDEGALRGCAYTKPRIGGRNWQRARNQFARAMGDASRSLRLARHAQHMRKVKGYTADAAVALTEAMAAFNEIVAIGEGQADGGT